MLSRVAESLYWTGRYIERAENVARFVDVNLNLMLDFPGSADHQWRPLVDITGARALAVLGDSITTDHISPAGSIKADSPAAAAAT